jgi:glutamate-1-semialdehyde 2,1-aminomutase/spore coat polysaccharide biosynthesis protein SpsF
VDAAIRDQLESGITFSLPSPLETELAERLVDIIPCAEMVRFGKNGTDATSAAIRLSRAFTGRERVIALGYHGWQDWYIGSTVRNKGVPKAVCDLTHKLPFNDLEAVKALVDTYPDEVAAIILEPMSADEPLPGYLEGLRDITRETGAILIFDEVITGFRFALGGAQELFGVTPDLAAFGKAMGNGMPISAVVGRADIMHKMEEVFYSGTFGGEALSLAASIAVIDKMRREPVIETLYATGNILANGVSDRVKHYALSDVIKVKGKAPWKILDFKDHSEAEGAAIKTLFMIEMLKNGVLIQGTHNVCFAHDEVDQAAILKAYDKVLFRIAEELDTGNLAERLPVPVIRPVFNVRGEKVLKRRI